MVSKCIKVESVYLAPINDEQEIRNILRQQNLYQEMAWDKIEDIETMDLELSVCQYLKVIINQDIAGFFCLQRIQSNGFIAHVGIYKKYRGYPAFAALMKFLDFCRDAYDYCTLYAFIPESRKLVARFAMKGGFQPVGALPNSVMVNGKFESQLLLQYNT